MKTLLGVFVVGLVLSSSVGCDGGDGSGGAGAGGASAGTTGSGGNGGTNAGGSGGSSTGTGGTSAGGGGTGGFNPTTGLPGSKRLDALTTQELQVLCDWTAAHFGGYGQTLNCGGGISIVAERSQAECVAGAPTTCPMTVSDFESCTNQTSCSNLIPDSCLPLLQCT